MPVSEEPPVAMARTEPVEPISVARVAGTDPIVVLSETED